MEDFRSTLGSTQTDRFRSPASFTAHERLSPCRLTMTSNIVGSGSPPPSTLKDEYEERQRLERQNFDLKLKVFHLEENIKKLQDVEVRHEVNSGIVRSEVSDLRLQLEEKDIELEQRNLLLMKAKAAIESMRQDLDNSRRDLEKQFDLEERVKRLKQMNDDIELDYKNQLLKLETELNSTRQSLGIREQEKSLLEEKVVRPSRPPSSLSLSLLIPDLLSSILCVLYRLSSAVFASVKSSSPLPISKMLSTSKTWRRAAWTIVGCRASNASWHSKKSTRKRVHTLTCTSCRLRRRTTSPKPSR